MNRLLKDIFDVPPASVEITRVGFFIEKFKQMIKLLLNLFCLPSMKFKKFLFWIFVVLSIAYYLFKAFNEFYFLRQPTRELPHDDSLFVSPAN